MKFLRKWAANLNYAAGPKAGSKSKIDPAGITADGIQPGTGQRLAAEGMNYLLDSLIEAQKAHLMSTLTGGLSVSGIQTNGICRNPATGRINTTASASNDFRSIDEDGSLGGMGAIPTALRGGTFVQCPNVSGSPGLYYANEKASDSTKVVIEYSTGASSYATVTGEFSVSNSDGSVWMSYDADNGCTVGIATGGGVANPGAFRIPDVGSGTPAASSPTSEPAPWPPVYSLGAGRRSIGSTGGLTVVCYEDSASTTYLAYSTDGGDNWTTGTSPVTTHRWVVGEDNFRGQGPRVVLCSDDQVYESNNGSDWSLVFTTGGLKIYGTIGDLLLWTTSSNILKVTDLNTLKTFAANSSGDAVPTNDGERVLLGDAATSGALSGFIRPGKADDFSDL